jgi:hypothetical protein
MAQQYQTTSATLTIPGAYAETVVQNNPSGLSTTGVLMLIGEAESGLDFTAEQDLGLNAFGPDQISDFVGKYKSGPLVDAFRGAATASNDAGIPGSFSRVIAVKTNKSAQASGTLPKIGGGIWGTLTDKSSGKSGNLISRTVVQATPETVPSTGAALICPPQVATDIEFRVNGGSALTASITPAMLPPATQAAINALAGVAASGGVNRGVVTAVAGNLTVAIVSGFRVTFTITGATYAANPSVGDLLYVPTGSPLATANEGTYVVSAATSTVITATKIRDAAGAGGVLTAPSAEGPIAIAATTDISAFSPIVISSEASAIIDGRGKTLEIADTSTGELTDIAFTASSDGLTATAAIWASTAATPAVVVSASEYSVTLTASRQVDSISDAITSGGDIAFVIGYDGTTASMVISNGVLTTTVTGGAGANLSVALKDYPTIADLSDYISSQAGYTAAPSDTSFGQLASTNLDEGTSTIASTHGARTGRIKIDGETFKLDVASGGSLVAITPVSPATKMIGLPDVSSLSFLSGGTKGATTNADILGALDALQAVRGNFVVPLFSRDATSDISDGITDAGSTYTIASIHANTRSHVLLMSQMKKRRPRQAFLSNRGTFKAGKQAAGGMASSRASMHFQDDRDTNSFGNITQFHPWMNAVKAAGMQAAGFYRPIVNKFIKTSGVLQAAADFNDQLDSHLEDALLNGLCPATRDESGGFRWVSDQTTYTKDSNFVYNSIQAVYVSDIISMTVAQRMERAFVGQSVADISAALALTTLEAIMGDMKRLKLIAASDDAPKGFLDAKIRIVGPAMVVSLTIKLAGAIYFIPVTFLVTPVTQSAG